MGAGIAAVFASRFPGLLEEYRAACASGELTLGGCFAYGSDPVVFNLGTQRVGGPYASLVAVRDAVTAMVDQAAARGFDRVGLPRIGAGIGGLDWPAVRVVLNQAAAAGPVDLVVVTPPPHRAAPTHAALFP